MKKILTRASFALTLLFAAQGSAIAAEKIAIGVPKLDRRTGKLPNLIEAIVTEKIRR